MNSVPRSEDVARVKVNKPSLADNRSRSFTQEQDEEGGVSWWCLVCILMFVFFFRRKKTYHAIISIDDCGNRI